MPAGGASEGKDRAIVPRRPDAVVFLQKAPVDPLGRTRARGAACCELFLHGATGLVDRRPLGAVCGLEIVYDALLGLRHGPQLDQPSTDRLQGALFFGENAAR